MTTNRSRFGFPPRARTSPILAKATTSQDTSTTTMRLYDPIDSWGSPWGISAKEFVGELAGVDADEIRLHINCPGGEVYDAIAIVNALRQHKARVVAIVDGVAASAASFIAAAADELVMAKNSEIFIHEAWGYATGNSTDLATESARLDQISANIASIYADKAGTDTDWRALMRAETWMSAQDALDHGLADRIEGVATDTAKNLHDLTVFARTTQQHPRAANAAPSHPRASAPGSTGPAAQASEAANQEGSDGMTFTPEQIADLRQAVGVSDDADEATLIDAVKEALAEQADPQETTTTTAPVVPEGMALVDEEVLNSLRADALAGREARDRQLAEERNQIVTAAVNDGRIAPSRKDAWIARLAADPAEVETLNALTPGLAVPTNELGTSAEPNAQVVEDPGMAAKAMLFPTVKEA